MTDRDRLIELLDDMVTQLKNKKSVTTIDIADHLLANGVILPPCKVGQTVWWADIEFEKLLKGKVVSFSLQEEGLWAYCQYNCGLNYWHLVSDYFGKTVFLTREEAERKLRKEDEGK